ncbi:MULTISPECIES: hypothetical protein [unclassified Microcoleus]|uniref:hypothetical protein n=1 Tax=unclassified Microcoleus TaxID=2642155 RepID=UPI002FD44799
MSEYTDLLREYARLSVINSGLSIENSELLSENSELLIESLRVKAENLRLTERLEQMNYLARAMYNDFKLDQPHGNLTENNRESLELESGGTIYLVQYLDRNGKSYISTEGFTPEGDIAPKLYYFGYAVFFMVEELVRQEFNSLPERFSTLFDRNPKFMNYVVKEFERVMAYYL